MFDEREKKENTMKNEKSQFHSEFEQNYSLLEINL